MSHHARCSVHSQPRTASELLLCRVNCLFYHTVAIETDHRFIFFPPSFLTSLVIGLHFETCIKLKLKQALQVLRTQLQDRQRMRMRSRAPRCQRHAAPASSIDSVVIMRPKFKKEM